MPAASPDDLDAWIRAFRGPLVGLVASWGLDWRAAEEVAQDAFAEAWVARERFVGEPSDLAAVGTWLLGIAFHLCRAQQRRAARRDHQPVESVHRTPSAEYTPLLDERRELLTEAFAGLDATHQTVLRMHYLEESSAREVAALLSISTKAAESRLYQARRALKLRIEHLARRSTTRGKS